MTKIVIADDHRVVRSGLRMLLDREEGFEVVAEAGDVADARRYVRAHRPDVLILDLNMPGDPSLPAIPVFLRGVAHHPRGGPDHAGGPGLRARGAPGRRERLRAQGGRRRGARPRRPGRGGRRDVPEPGARRPHRRGAAEPAGPPDDLTEREVEILRLIALGHTNSEIAGQLYLSVRTVESHRAHIQQKIRLTSRAELVHYALEHGLVTV